MIYVAGNIVNESGQRVTTPGRFYLYDPQANITTTPTENTDGTFRAWTEAQYYYTILFIFEFEGYAKKIVQFSSLPDEDQAEATIVLEKASNKAALIAAGAILLFILATSNKKTVGKLEAKDVLPYIVIVGALYGFGIIDKILEALGITDSQDTQNLNNATIDPNSFWTPVFWQKKPVSTPWTYTIDYNQATAYARTLWDAMGAWNDDEAAAISVFRAMRTQANVSYLAYVFQQEYGKDLLAWLRGGTWPNDRLSDADVNDINNFISRLPKY